MGRGQLPNRIRRGDVVWVDDPFAFEGDESSSDTDDHPYVVISTDDHPFQGTEYLAMLITTSKRSDSISISGDRWEFGTLSRPSYISPWTVVTVKDVDLDSFQGTLNDRVVDEAVERLPPYIGLTT